MKNIICLDLETTGKIVSKETEIIQLGIIDAQFNTVFNEYFKPEVTTEWPVAEAKNHISPEMVKDKQPISAWKDKIIEILDKADVVIGYNLKAFDIPLLEMHLNYKFKCQIFDVMTTFMKEFALHKNISFRLDNVAEVFGIANDNAHDALNDVIVTMKCFYKMGEEAKKPVLSKIYKFSDGKEIFTESLANAYRAKTGAQMVDITYLENGQVIHKSDVKDMSAYRICNVEKKVCKD